MQAIIGGVICSRRATGVENCRVTVQFICTVHTVQDHNLVSTGSSRLLYCCAQRAPGSDLHRGE
jgi:hypothetical protein